MNKADKYFVNNIKDILENGSIDENPRPRYESDGEPAHSIFITQVFEKYDLSKNEFPLTTLRPIPVVNGFKEEQWIYNDQTSDLSVLEDKYGVMWWRDWEISSFDEELEEMVKTNTIGQRYGATVKKYDLMNQFLDGLMNDEYGRRHIINLWQNADFTETEGLKPCAFLVIASVRKNIMTKKKYLDLTLVQRSSDYLVAGHINKMQYVAFMMKVAKHCRLELGKFAHFVQNLHIYDKHVKQAEELMSRTPSEKQPILKLNVSDGTNYYDINYTDFELVDYEPVRPQLKFELGI